ncbi:acyl-CoA reductase [soil metagenome]
MNLTERVSAFVKLGEEFTALLNGAPTTEAGRQLLLLLPELQFRNGWYSEDNIRHRLTTLAGGLQNDVLDKWLSAYAIKENVKPEKVGVILAGNIPLVGFDDFRCVLLSGNIFFGKTSSDDKFLLPLVSQILLEIEPRFSTQIEFTEGQLPGIDAIIATGSNNSARYFEHYFAKYPHIIRSNRNGVAVISGNETNEELAALGEDIFRYFGLGCRNVTKLFVPQNYNFNAFFEAIFPWGKAMLTNNKYMNNYDYHKTLYLLSSLPLLDNNFLLLKEDAGISSPPGVVFYEKYNSLEEVKMKLESEYEKIQCVMSAAGEIPGAVAIGNSQVTGPADYADGVDVMAFLVGLG